MKAVSVRELKNNPSAALRAAREQPVVVLNRHEPEAVLIHLSDDSLRPTECISTPSRSDVHRFALRDNVP